MSVVLLPEFADETRLNPGRAPGGRATTPSGRSIPVCTRYGDLPTVWSLEVEVSEDGELNRTETGLPLHTAGGWPGLRGWDEDCAADRFLYAMDQAGQLYAADPTTLSPDAVAWSQGRRGMERIEVWHHSSFVAGQPVICAGDLETDAHGRLIRISNRSGHYKPGPEAFAAMLQLLAERGLPLRGVLAEIVQPDGSVRIVDAATLCAQGHQPEPAVQVQAILRQDAIALVCRWTERAWTKDADERLDRWIDHALAANDPEVFDASDPDHWAWIARWALEGKEPHESADREAA